MKSDMKNNEKIIFKDNLFLIILMYFEKINRDYYYFNNYKYNIFYKKSLFIKKQIKDNEIIRCFLFDLNKENFILFIYFWGGKYREKRECIFKNIAKKNFENNKTSFYLENDLIWKFSFDFDLKKTNIEFFLNNFSQTPFFILECNYIHKYYDIPFHDELYSFISDEIIKKLLKKIEKIEIDLNA